MGPIGYSPENGRIHFNRDESPRSCNLGFYSRLGQDMFLFSKTSRPSLGPAQPPIQCTPAVARVLKRTGREVNHFRLVSRLNEWSSTSTSHLCFDSVDRENVTLLLSYSWAAIAQSLATRYELDGLRIESRWRRDFPHRSRPAMWPTQPPIQWVPGCFPAGGVNRPRRGVNHPPPFSAEVKERVEVYLCFTSGPSWPVLRRTLPYSWRSG